MQRVARVPFKTPVFFLYQRIGSNATEKFALLKMATADWPDSTNENKMALSSVGLDPVRGYKRKSEPKSTTRNFLPALSTLKYKNHVWPWKRRQGEGKGKEPIQPRGTSIPRRSRPQIPPQGKLRRESGCWCPSLLGCRPRVPHC